MSPPAFAAPESYRPEIDGLRAVAVLSVVLMHAGLPHLPAGFLGVDVFFAISGYLITGILLDEFAHGRFSLIGFYERRARRILPALLLVVLCCIPIAVEWMRPSRLDDFGKAIVAVATFSLNILAWHQVSYFAPIADFQPLLHTWSLAVEEQFYLIVPLLMFALYRFGRTALWLGMAALAVTSFAIAMVVWRDQPDAAFYLLPARAWEILAGGLLALYPHEGPKSGREVPALGGLTLVVASLLASPDELGVYGPQNAAAIAGTVLILRYARGRTVAARVLGFRPLAAIGLASYSIYLWHQPLLVFTRMRIEGGDTLTGALVAVAMAIVLGGLTWRFVERPFRRHGQGPLPTTASFFLVAGIGCAILVATGMILHRTHGLPDRVYNGHRLSDLDDRLAINFGLNEACENRFTLSRACATHGTADTLLWGDSFAMHLAPGLVASDPAIRLRQHTLSSCPPLAGLALVGAGREYDPRHARRCLAFNDEVLAWLARHPEVKTVILSSSLTIYAPDALLPDGRRIVAKPLAVRRAAAAALGRTVARIRATGARVVLVSPTPQSGAENGICLQNSAKFDMEPTRCDFAEADSRAHGYPEELLADAARIVPVIRLDKMICTAGTCHVSLDNRFVFRDTGHLSIEGSRYLGERHHWADLVKRAAR